jgi:CHAD domain-containing protein
MAKQLQKYGNKRFAFLNTDLKKYKQHIKPEQLHQMRVELKKIKNLFGFLAFSSKKFNAKKN